MSKVVSVVISNATREFDKEYHYSLPGDFEEKVKPGMRVIVPFGKSNKSIEAFVLELIDSSEIKGLKAVKKIIDESLLLSKGMLKLIVWMKDRYICTYSDAIRCVLPPGIGVKGICAVRLIKPTVQQIIEDTSLLTSNTPIQKRILELLVESGGEYDYEELRLKIHSTSFTKNIKKLEETGNVEVFSEYTKRVNDKTIRLAYLNMAREEVIDDIESNRIKKIQQIRVLEMLLENEAVSMADIVRFCGVSSGVLDTLKKYGYIEFKDMVVSRNPLKHKTFKDTLPLEPTPGQAIVLEEVKKILDSNRFGEILLHGVTGSGKTEVYLQLIQHCIEKNRQAIVLVPEISLTPQMVERFKGRFGNDVAVLHSRLSMGERVDQWRLIKDGKIKVAVGARSAIFAPFENLGLIIIDEEHEGTYKSEMTPKYKASDVAREICLNYDAVLLYGSATPSVETYYRAKKKDILLLEMHERTNNACMPEVRLIDLRRELDEGNRSVFSRRLIDEISKNVQAKQQTILFLNRRGYASFVLCRACGYTARCINCNISLTYHSYDERLICHYCGYTVKSPETCPKCKSSHIRHFGTGTQKIEEEIKKQFPESTVIRMDMDTTTGKNSHEGLLRAFREENIDILVGTQMIAKGHDFPNVTLVGVLAADSLLNLDDYRASERTFQLLTQVAGRAGRGEHPGRVVIQTYNIEDFSILAACKHDFISFYNQEIKIRAALNYPPFTNIGVAILSSVNDRYGFQWSKKIKEMSLKYFADEKDGFELLGPVRSPISKIKNKYRWRIVIKCNNMDKLKNVLSRVSDDFYKLKGKNTIELSVDINPINML